jgi:hypothetical protein
MRIRGGGQSRNPDYCPIMTRFLASVSSPDYIECDLTRAIGNVNGYLSWEIVASVG